jgi:hypothetical protein
VVFCCQNSFILLVSFKKQELEGHGITKQQYDNLQESQNRKLKDIDVKLSRLTNSQENQLKSSC